MHGYIELIALIIAVNYTVSINNTVENVTFSNFFVVCINFLPCVQFPIQFKIMNQAFNFLGSLKSFFKIPFLLPKSFKSISTFFVFAFYQSEPISSSRTMEIIIH